MDRGQVTHTIYQLSCVWEQGLCPFRLLWRSISCIGATALLTLKLTKAEIRKAIKQLKNGKAADIDENPAEALKGDPEMLAEMLYRLFEKIRDKRGRDPFRMSEGQDPQERRIWSMLKSWKNHIPVVTREVR